MVKPDRLTKSNEALLILGFIGGLMISEFIFGASHFRDQGLGLRRVRAGDERRGDGAELHPV